MKQWISGFVVGAVLASSLVGVAANNFQAYYRVGDILGAVEGTEPNLQGLRDMLLTGYTTGAADGLDAVLYYMSISEATFAEDVKRLDEARRCLAFRGKTAGALSSFAKASWKQVAAGKRDAGAAFALFAAACEP